MLPGTSQNPDEAFLDLGHTSVTENVFASGDRVLSRAGSRWILWDTTTRTQVAGGVTAGDVEMRGHLVLITTTPGSQFELRSANDGSLSATVLASYRKIGLAIDGSYAWAEADDGITAWDPTGTELVHSSTAFVNTLTLFAAPNELRIALGSAGANVIELIPIDGSPPSVTPPFSGTFVSFFGDGQRFLTVSSAVRVYSKDAVQEMLVVPQEGGLLGGTGDYFWTYNIYAPYRGIHIYRVGGGDAPVASFTDYDRNITLISTERAVILLPEATPSLDVIDLGGPSVVRTRERTPPPDNTVAHVDPGMRWVVGSAEGVVYQKGTIAAPDSAGALGCGQPLSVAGTLSGDVAIATAKGEILVFNTTNLDADAKESIPFYGLEVQFSGDGSVLAARSRRDDDPYAGDITAFALPSGAELASWTDERFYGFSLSFGGTTLGRSYHSGRDVTERDGTQIWYHHHDAVPPSPLPSPDGSHFVVSDGFAADQFCGSTLFYEGTTLVNAVPGCAVGWIDDNRVLIQTYEPGPPRGFDYVYKASTIYDAQGSPLASPPLPKVTMLGSFLRPRRYGFTDGFQPISTTAIYARYEDTIYDLDTGAPLATFPAGHKGTVAGAFIVYPCADGVCAVPR